MTPKPIGASGCNLRRFLFFLLVFVSWTVFLVYFIAQHPPHHQDDKRPDWSWSSMFADLRVLRQLALELRSCVQLHKTYVMGLFIAIYLYNQTFAVPGTFSLNVLCGSMLPWYQSIALCALLTTIGSSFCYFMVSYCAKYYAKKRFDQQIRAFEDKLKASKRSLLVILIMARAFPASPSWLLNFILPVLNVPYHIFAISTAIGQLPYIVVGVQTGVTLTTGVTYMWRSAINVTMKTLSDAAVNDAATIDTGAVLLPESDVQTTALFVVVFVLLMTVLLLLIALYRRLPGLVRHRQRREDQEKILIDI